MLHECGQNFKALFRKKQHHATVKILEKGPPAFRMHLIPPEHFANSSETIFKCNY